jgi:hypothetical protein
MIVENEWAMSEAKVVTNIKYLRIATEWGFVVIAKGSWCDTIYPHRSILDEE